MFLMYLKCIIYDKQYNCIELYVSSNSSLVYLVFNRSERTNKAVFHILNSTDTMYLLISLFN